MAEEAKQAAIEVVEAGHGQGGDQIEESKVVDEAPGHTRKLLKIKR